MENFKELGNIEFLNCFFALHFKRFGYIEMEFANYHLAEDFEELTKDYLRSFRKRFDEETLYRAFLVEAQNRGLNEQALLGSYPTKEFIYSDEFIKWQESMNNNPTYIREVMATDNWGDRDIGDEFEYLMLDMPVRDACKILNEKGYLTYWSSANQDDFYKRKGHVIQDKSVVYILIDPQNLSTEIKERLYLNGKCDFWGLAIHHNDNGKYYGIWAEITSDDMLCTDLSKDLSAKTLELPTLMNIQSQEYSSRQL